LHLIYVIYVHFCYFDFIILIIFCAGSRGRDAGYGVWVVGCGAIWTFCDYQLKLKSEQKVG